MYNPIYKLYEEDYTGLYISLNMYNLIYKLYEDEYTGLYIS